MKTKITFSCLAIVGFAASSLAQTIWTDGAGDQTWSTASNWSAGVPTSTSAVQIGTQPTGDLIGIDTGATVVASFAFNNTLTSSVDIAPFGPSDTLQVNGAITNNSGFTNSFSIGVIAGASATWTGPLNFTSSATLGTNTITAVNSLTFAGLTLDVASGASYGKFAGAGSVQLNNTLSFNFTSATGAGSWDIAASTLTGTLTNVSVGGSYTASFTESTPGTWSATSGGLSWTYSSSTGVLTAAVPEPGTWALLAGGLTTIMILRRRRK